MCVQDGIQAVQTWIDKLIRPGGSPYEREQTLANESDADSSSYQEPSPPPAKRIKIEPGYINTSQGQIMAPVLPPRFSSALPRFSNTTSTLPVVPRTQTPPVHQVTRVSPPSLPSVPPAPPASLLTHHNTHMRFAHTTSPSPIPAPTAPSMPRRDLPPHLPDPRPIPPNPLAPTQPKAAFLPMFNQLAMKRKVEVKYTTVSVGPPHSCVWRASCLGQ